MKGPLSSTGNDMKVIIRGHVRCVCPIEGMRKLSR